jgi:hypothetical protein
MSYRPQRSLSGGRWRGPGRGMGDSFAAPGSGAAEALAGHVNRFGPSAPAAYRFVDHALTLAGGKITPELALAALAIYQRRATEAYNQFHDAGSEVAITRANTGFADPVGFVTANLPEVTAAVAGFADSLGLSAAGSTGPDGAGSGGVIGGIDSQTLLMVAGGALVLWLVTR